LKDRKEILENINNSIFKPFSLESLKLNTIEHLEYKQIQKLDDKINTTIFDEEITYINLSIICKLLVEHKKFN
jgi:hypothetical protein